MIAPHLFVPTLTSSILGAVHLRFFSRHPLPGLLLQAALAFSLALWHRANPTA